MAQIYAPWVRWLFSGSLAAVSLAGCSHSKSSQPLSPGAFYDGRPRIEEDPRSEVNNPAPSSGVTFPRPRLQDPLPPPNVTPVTQPAATRPAATSDSIPAASRTGASSGQFQLIGTVVAEVNGTPIFANKVLMMINKPLMAKARELDEAKFKQFAAGLIQNQIGELVNDEVLFAAAQRALSEEDQKIVDSMTQQWRGQQITLAGGSVQLAKSKAVADGDDFDEVVRQQFRRNMIEMYRYRKLTPRIQVTIDDLRRYYDRHKEDEFTEHEAARFRLLEVEVTKTGSREQALEKIRQKYDRARSGEDFAVMCAKENDNPAYAKASGDMGWLNRGSFAKEKVEAEVWKLQPGQITDIIDGGGSFYIAKLEEVRHGRVRSFNEQPNGKEQSVQEVIRNKLQRDQFRELTIEIDQRLRRDAIVRSDEKMISLCVDMAMQRYGEVAGKMPPRPTER